MDRLLNRRVWIVWVMTLSLFVATPAWADTDSIAPAPSAAAMTLDMAVVRPISLAATVLGTGLFIVSLPISALGHNTGAAGERLVAEPAKYTFARPLGNFDVQPVSSRRYEDAYGDE